MSYVDRWTGVEVRHLRQARRMSVRAFAEHLGVTARAVTRWEGAGETIRPRAVNQAALDESLKRCTIDEVRRFEQAQEQHPVTRSQPATSVRWGLVVDLHPHDIRLARSITLAVERVLRGRSSEPRRRPGS